MDQEMQFPAGGRARREALALGGEAKDSLLPRSARRWLSGLASGTSVWTGRCLALVAAYLASGYVVAACLGLPLHWPVRHLLQQAQLVVLLAYGPILLLCLIDRWTGPRMRFAHL